MYCAYIIFSESIRRFFIGRTDDLKGTMEKHNAGSVPGTSRGAPWKICCYFDFPTKAEAVIMEKRMKKLRNREQMMRFIDQSVAEGRGRVSVEE